VDLQRIAVLAGRTRPVEPGRDGGGVVVWRLGALVGHLEEEEVGQLLDVVAVGEAVVAQDVAVVPEFLDDLLAVSC
jgi:hypothetical protein